MMLLFDESLSPRLILLLHELFPESESALRNGLARASDRRIPESASGFERQYGQIPSAKVVIMRSCDHPTDVAAEVLLRNAIRIAELRGSQDHLIILHEKLWPRSRPPQRDIPARPALV